MAEGTNLGMAYVQIMPSAKGIKGNIENLLGGDVDSAGKSLGDRLGGAIKKAAKVGAAALGGISTALGFVTKNALDAYGSYEQLVGGVETLFKDSADIVQDYAANAYKTAGLSANEYMETAIGFSASLLQSLGGDTEKAAQMTDVAITDMSDNANKLGTSMESIQYAYQGFAKQNYTMLDNLKLGYGGTKEEMERLLSDAEKLPSAIGRDFDISNYADVVEAIHLVQTEMGISGISAEEAAEAVKSGAMTEEEAFEAMGTTAKEASTTIQGSLSSLKGAWSNLLTGVADDQANLGLLIDQFVSSIETAADNIVPRIGQILTGIGTAVQRLAPIISEQLPGIISTMLPALLTAGASMLTGITDGIVQAIPDLIGPAIEVVSQLGNFIVENLPILIDAAMQIILQLAAGIADNLPKLMPAVVDVILQIVDTLIDNVDKLVDASIEIILALAYGIIEALPRLLARAPEIIQRLVAAIIENTPKLLSAGAQALGQLAIGIVQSLPQLANSAWSIVQTIRNTLKDLPGLALQWGADMLQSFINGIVSRMQNLLSSVKSIAQGIANLLGFSEPKEGPLSDFHTYAPDMMELYAKGIAQNRNKLLNTLETVSADMAIPFRATAAAPSTGAPAGPYAQQNTIGSVIINVQGAPGQDVSELADIVIDRLTSLYYRKAAAMA